MLGGSFVVCVCVRVGARWWQFRVFVGCVDYRVEGGACYFEWLGFARFYGPFDWSWCMGCCDICCGYFGCYGGVGWAGRRAVVPLGGVVIVLVFVGVFVWWIARDCMVLFFLIVLLILVILIVGFSV